MQYIDYKAIGQTVQRLRKNSSLTQEQMAEKCNISTSYLGHIERGTRNLSLELACKISSELNVSLDALVLDAISPDESILPNIASAVKKQEADKQKLFISLVRVMAEHLDEIDG
ncbi:MAG: helix-turn-helix domain-containing protein [Clostridiales Family XIII bacterium]|jgi:transcriptional regulator with XRE-family HTH domain|nr:helix-turn-helix domain-containing protein [Clostridiales Family XIII bacterium]